MATAVDVINFSDFDHFQCNICLEILKEPVQCLRNEHYFCKSCITRHLTRSERCPVCQDELTTETLRPISRVVANLLQQYQSPKCQNASRGCTAVLRREVLLSHHEECGFAPVSCSHDGCEQTVNKQDFANHEQDCEFRLVTCEDCQERMSQREYEKHPCVLRKELNDNRRGLVEVQNILREIQEKQLQQGNEIQRLTIRELRQPRPNDTQHQQNNDIGRQAKAGGQPISESAPVQDPSISVNSIPGQIERPASVNKKIFVAGGTRKSFAGVTAKSCEVFDWSTKEWKLYKNVLFFDRVDAVSFLYEKKITICGGIMSNRVESLEFNSDSTKSTISVLPSMLRDKDCGKGVLCGDNILTFGKSISATNLKPPFKTEVLLSYNDMKFEELSSYGVACVNENAVIMGGQYKCLLPQWGDRRRPYVAVRSDVLLYNPRTKQLQNLAPLPYEVADLAVLPYNNESIIILGGSNISGCSSNDALMYNITTQQSSRLPNMLKPRSRCAAVIMGDTIVAIGGESGKSVIGEQNKTERYKTAEYLKLGDETWKELPPMHEERAGATACVLP